MHKRMELIKILKTHTEKYPLMQPCDAVKLLYQNEFGGGHLIPDPRHSLARLLEEYASLRPSASVSLYEKIGNGLVRVYLSAIKPEIYSLQQLNRDFVESSAFHKGSLTSFISKLEILTAQFDTFSFSFSKESLFTYLEQYKKDGFPMVSHSAIYRNTYHPAYRVIRKEILPFSLL